MLTVRLDQWPLDVSDRNLLHTRVSGAAAAVAVGAITPLARKINVDKAVQGRAGAGFDCDFLCYIATETLWIYPRRA